MAWRKLGRIFVPSGGSPWMETHAAVPVAEVLADDRVRVYFSARDADKRSSIGHFEFDPAAPSTPRREAVGPVLGPGARGAFDEDGVTACWLVSTGGRKLLYYTGWSRGLSVPFRNAIGLAVSDDGGETFHRYATGPVLDRGIHDPFFTVTPCVLKERDTWRMWYSTCQSWSFDAGAPRHHYNIAYATSRDGIDWRRDGTVCVDFASDAEYVITRPCVVAETSRYRMWYSYRGERFRIGYAESAEGTLWTRRNGERGLEPSAAGWDSEMVEYPYVFDCGGQRYMLYNGDGFGRTGIGLAIKEP